MKKKLLFITVILVLIVGWILLKQDFKKSPPTLYYNANIITVNNKQPTANAMLVVDGIVQEIGDLKKLPKFKNEGLKKINLKGATIMPGFIDVHTHFALSMFFENMYDLSGFKHKSNTEVWKYFENCMKNSTQNEWLVFKGLDPVLVSDLKTPTLEYLDKISPNNPVVIFSQSLHSYWVNSKAFESVGITKNTKNPSKNSFYERDLEGNLTGLITEQEAFKPFIEKLKKEVLTPKILSNSSVKTMTNYAKNGNTTIVSTGLTINDTKPLILMKHLSDKTPNLLGNFLAFIGQLPERKPTPRHFIYVRHDMTHILPETKGKPNDFYDIIGIKHWYDGSPYTGSMYINEPYLTTDLTANKLHIKPNSNGKALLSKEKLKEFITKYHKRGWQIAIHAQGNAANIEVINAFEELNSQLNFNKSRHRLEHCLLLPETELLKIKKLNLFPSFHINHLLYYGDALNNDILGEKRTSKILPVKSALNQKIISTLHADQPMFESKPFRLIQTAIERKTKEGIVIGKNEQLNLLEAIESLTINAAYQIHKENKIGSLEKGKYADFIVLDKNPYTVKTENLHKIKCIQTFINGNKTTY
ncbi:amidohydrolase [uncultured Tenacibaculum sp.]|uniref:amidohydrolase n=1 Tax=uncultured Tenacibaculum sp. TaxID=174713 RepID=UPI002630637D|nr:amidohydrolase [uncultured Tenacibaculum sp.]